jgi:hypothetical protein
MNQQKTYNNCRNFFIRNSCSHKNEKLMNDFIDDLEPSSGSNGRVLDYSKAEEVNKAFCNTCNSFKSNRI